MTFCETITVQQRKKQLRTPSQEEQCISLTPAVFSALGMSGLCLN